MDYKYDFYIVKTDELENETNDRVRDAINHFNYDGEDVICITVFGTPSIIYTFNNAKKFLDNYEIANINVAGAMIVERLNAEYLELPVSYA